MTECVTPKVRTPRLSRVFQSGLYDQIIVGGGPAGVFTASRIMELAHQSGKPLSLLLITDYPNVPCTAGSHLAAESEGFYEDDFPNRAEVIALHHKARQDLYDAIAAQKIDCRLHTGYEIKARNKSDLGETIGMLVENGLYKPQDLGERSAQHGYVIKTHPHSVTLNGCAQVNSQELLVAMRERAQELGSHEMVGVHYLGHKKTEDNTFRIETDSGLYISKRPPIIATGASHQHTLPWLPFQRRIYHTMAATIGPVQEKDARLYSPSGPMAFRESNFKTDFMWGGIDEKNEITFGMGDIPEKTLAPSLKNELLARFNAMHPGLLKAYQPQFHLGTVMETANKLPVTLDLGHCIIVGASSSWGLIPSYASAGATAKKVVFNDDRDLKLLQSIHDEGRKAAPDLGHAFT